MRKIILALLILAFAAGYAQQFTTPLVKNQYHSLSCSTGIMHFLDSLQQVNENLRLDTAGFSVTGKPVPLLSFRITADPTEEDKKPFIFMFAQQHGNEPSGKEGLLLLIEDLAQGRLNNVLDSVNLLLMPQVNPDGGDLHQRRNANNIDLNRDHLLMRAPETRAVERVFEKYRPVVSVDIHEYYPYSDSWEAFGYQRDFDIQVGTLTNPNISDSLIDCQRAKVLPYIEKHLTRMGYSFFEYTLGHFPSGERLRHSTTDINDGRQSIGITNTMTFIVEGMNGRDSTHRIRERALSQYETAKAIAAFSAQNITAIAALVDRERKAITETKTDSVIIRQDHFDSEDILEYPLKSVKTGKDTVFRVDNFHNEIKALLKVKAPRGYLIRKTDSTLVDLMRNNHFIFEEYQRKRSDVILGKQILEMNRKKNEGLLTPFPMLMDKFLNKLDPKKYYIVPTNQLRKYKIIIAFEPRSMFGIGFYEEFSEYMQKNKLFPAIRVE